MHEIHAAVASSRDRLDSEVEQAGQKAAETALHHARQHARSYGWPESAVDSIRVRYHPNGAFEAYSEDEAALTHEYGGVKQRPRAALRTWTASSHEYASEAHDAALAPLVSRELF